MNRSFQFDFEEKNIGVVSLKMLRTNWENNKVPVPEKEGFGNFVDEVEEIVVAYEELYQSFMALLDNTISFIDRAGDEIKSVDDNISDLIKQKGL